jgi:hypothetical protein
MEEHIENILKVELKSENWIKKISFSSDKEWQQLYLHFNIYMTQTLKKLF